MDQYDTGKIRLLLVDDEEGFRTALAKRLKKRDIDIVQACDGEQCLDILKTRPADIVVLDVKMPGMTGIEVLKIIRQTYPLIQVILLTGNIAVSDGIEGIKSGAFDYLTKPVEFDHLVYKIKQAYETICREKEAQEELEYRKKLEKKMIDTERLVSLGTMSTGIAHEINNPLAVINEAAGFMKQVLDAPEIKDNPKRDALMLGIEKIEKSIKRARKITHQLLGHVKKQDSSFARVDISALVERTLSLLKKEIRDKQIHVNMDIDHDKSIVWSDPYQIRQVLMNLLSNAVHAVKEKGSISLSTKQVNDNIVLEIKDTGIGIPEENLGKIFDPFFTTKSFEEGTGLGLFVVHKIIKGLNGMIDVTSTVGKGTCFKITLPRHNKTNK